MDQPQVPPSPAICEQHERLQWAAGDGDNAVVGGPEAQADRSRVAQETADSAAAATFIESIQQPVTLPSLCKKYAEDRVLSDLEAKVGEARYADWLTAYAEAGRAPGAALQRTSFLVCIRQARHLVSLEEEDDRAEALKRSLKVWELVVCQHQVCSMRRPLLSTRSGTRTLGRRQSRHC